MEHSKERATIGLCCSEFVFTFRLVQRCDSDDSDVVAGDASCLSSSLLLLLSAVSHTHDASVWAPMIWSGSLPPGTACDYKLRCRISISRLDSFVVCIFFFGGIRFRIISPTHAHLSLNSTSHQRTHSTPSFSTPVFSIPATWYHVFHSRVFYSRVFSAPSIPLNAGRGAGIESLPIWLGQSSCKCIP